MDKSLQLYKKAVGHYSRGNLDKALEYCERSISNNIKNSAAINLKGLLYYFKGELESAQALWKMNYQVNKDLVSNKYLEDSKNDFNKKLMYKAALIALKELKVREAVNLLLTCRESDFNSISVNNLLAVCYIKLGEYNKSLKQLEEVRRIDKKNIDAAKTERELVDLGVVKRKLTIKYIVLTVVCISLIMLAAANRGAIKNILFSIPSGSGNIKTPAAADASKALGKKETEAKSGSSAGNGSPVINSSPNNSSQEGNSSTTGKKVFDSSTLSKAVQDKDYESIYRVADLWKNESLSINDKSLLQDAISLLQTSGVEYFYNNGRNAMKSNDYKTSIIYLAKAYTYGENYYLYQDILYMLGYSYKSDKQIDNCIRYYNEYDSKFPNGTYEETVLYELALIYKPLDVKTSKNYAARLSKQYPKSIYNNTNIKEILAS